MEGCPSCIFIQSMKVKIAASILILLFSCTAAGQSPARKEWTQDALNEHYRHLPLKKLLKDLRLKPLRVFVTDGTPGSERLPHFSFVLSNENAPPQRNKYNMGWKRLVVYVNEEYHWHKDSLPLAERFLWSRKDRRRYGDLTIAYMRLKP